MSEIVSLIREFPFGSFLIITAIISGFFALGHALINRNKPTCECDCCVVEEDDDCEDDEDQS